MLTKAQALREFRERFAAMIEAANTLHAVIEAEADEPADAKNAKVALVQRIVAEHFGYTVHRMLERDRHAEIALVRQTAMALAKEFTRCGIVRIAQDFGGFDHGTVCYAAKAVAERASVDPEYAHRFAAVREKVRAAIEQTHLNPLVG
jgi:chromosomal replication initiation ATPase DnaA